MVNWSFTLTTTLSISLGQYNELEEYCDPHTASSVLLILVPNVQVIYLSGLVLFLDVTYTVPHVQEIGLPSAVSSRPF